jgi:hypothetical protein
MESFKESETILNLPKIKTSELNELKNIKYKTSTKVFPEINNLSQVELFLENEKTSNRTEPWNKLDKTTKYKKIEEYAITYASKNNLSQDEESELIVFLKDAIDKKKIYRVKDIIYDKIISQIQDIPGLVFLNNGSKKFTLKNITKINTVKIMPKKE